MSRTKSFRHVNMRCALVAVLFCVGAWGGCASRRERTAGGPADATRPAPAREQSREFVDQAKGLRGEGREDEALALLTRAIELNPTLTVAHLEIGDIFEERGDYESAEQAYGTAATQQPTNFDAQFGHGRVLQLLNRVAEAVRAYLRALAIRPDNFDANLALASAYLQIDGPAQALPYAQRSVQLNPSSGAAHANLGSVYQALSRHREAVEQYQAAAELMELTPALLLNMAASLGKIERYEEMINTLDAAQRIEPSAVISERIGFAQFKLRRFDEAMAAFTRAVEIDPNHFPAHNGLGVCYLNQYILSGKADPDAHDRAIRSLKQSLRINSRQPRIVDLVARYER